MIVQISKRDEECIFNILQICSIILQIDLITQENSNVTDPKYWSYDQKSFWETPSKKIASVDFKDHTPPFTALNISLLPAAPGAFSIVKPSAFILRLRLPVMA